VVDANLLVREFLLSQSEVTALLGTNLNGSIYCGYDLPEHFDPTLGPAIQVYRIGGHTHTEIKALVDARMNVRVWLARSRRCWPRRSTKRSTTCCTGSVALA